jgi:small basic protein
MTMQPQQPSESDWRRFIQNHKVAFAAFIIAAIAAAAGAVYVFVWFTGDAQATGLVPSTLNLWTMNNLVWFIIYAVFWELVLIGIPVAVGAILGWAWWKRIPEAEKQQYNLSTKGSKGSSAGGGVSTLLFIAFAIKVYVDGYWNNAIASYTLDYVVGSMVTILIWIAAILAIPAVIAFIWWVSRR